LKHQDIYISKSQRTQETNMNIDIPISYRYYH